MICVRIYCLLGRTESLASYTVNTFGVLRSMAHLGPVLEKTSSCA